FNNAQLVAGAGQEDVQKSLIAVEARATGVALAFKGEDSHLRARDQGYLIEVAEQAGASLALSAGAKMTGLTQKSAGGQLSVALDQAQWQLAANKRFTDAQAQASSFDELNMVNQSRLLAHDGANGAAAAYVLQGKVSNAGSAIELNNGVVGDVLTIDGDYHGDAGVVKMDTVWDAPGNVTGGQSQSDVLHITGAASGLTKVIPTDAHGKTILIKGTVKQVAERLNSVPVVIVDQDHDGEGRAGAQSMAFVGTAATEGMAEAQLYRDGNQYKWTLAAAEAPIPPVEPPKPVNPPTEPPVNPKPTILAPEVVGYAQMPYANMALSYAMAATLHERVSEQQSLAWDECGQCQDQVNSQTWARIVGQKLDVNGKQRMNQEGDLYLVQVGHDFDLSVNEQTGSRRHTGLMASYGRHELDFYDRLGAVNGVLAGTRYTGKGNTDAFSLGAYQTHYQASGAYLDLMGQVTYLRNKYESRDNINVSQNGWGGLVSAEVGRPYAVGSSAWLVEPQAQLMYQYLHLSDFHDGKRKVDQDDQQGLRGRLGVRLAHNQGSQAQRSRTVYAVANVWHDFLNAKGVSVGPDAYRERHQTTWGELGLGLQLPLGKQTYAYADARYEHALSGAKHQGYRGTLGMKYQWR
nr:autotransporter outer membrane beta-barrel domain-containing protein [Neisseriaceae bacterium]